MVTPGVGSQGAVTVVARPANGQGNGVAGSAIRIGIGQIGGGDIGTCLDLGLFKTTTKEDRVRLAERDTKAHRRTRGHQLVVTALVFVRLVGAVVQIHRARNAVLGEIGVGGAEHQGTAVLAGVDVDTQVVARAKEVFLLDTERQRDLFGTGETCAQLQRTGGLLGHIDHEIHLVWRARYILGLHIHFGEKAQTVHAVAGQANALTVIPGCFILAEFTTNHFITRAVVAAHVDLAHIGTA